MDRFMMSFKQMESTAEKQAYFVAVACSFVVMGNMTEKKLFTFIRSLIH
jgi:hypothetical protein